MKMKLILENWKKFSLLSEGMKMPKDLPEGVFVTIVDNDPHFRFYYSGEYGEELQENAEVFGSVMISRVSEDLDGGKCHGGMTVVETKPTKNGWGPLLYDVALEFATKNSNGLMSDRSDVTDDAAAVWQKYLYTRSDVEKKQMDNKEDELTPGYDEDNCEQSSAEDWADEKGSKWPDSPLSKIYKKENANITAELDSLNKLLRKS